MRILSLIPKVFSHWIAVSFLLILLTIVDSFGQYKYEKESRIHSSELPFQLDLDFGAYAGVKRLKWYKELNVDQVHYEAKFRLEGSDYSVEFDSLGVLEDVEVLCSLKNLEDSLSRQLTKNINSLYKKWKIDKLQEQYLINQDVLKAVLDQSVSLKHLSSNYEMELIVLAHGERNHYELLFDSNLNLIRTRRIIKDSSLNLEF